jgi:hypothetical protein
MKKIVLVLFMVILVSCQSNNENVPSNNVVDVVLNDDVSNNTIDNEVSESHETNEVASDLILLGSLVDGKEVYYKLDEPYKSRQIASEIYISDNGELTTLSDVASSIPQINAEKTKVAFVQNVGFEKLGKLYIYDTHLYQLTSNELKEKEDSQRTLKDCTWYQDKLLVILGFNSGTITEGGDVYMINVDTGDLRMVIDAKDMVEIVNISYSNPNLEYELLYWMDENYVETKYINKSIVLADYISQLPIKENRQEDIEISEVSILTLSEIEALDWYKPEVLLEEFADQENLGDDAFYEYDANPFVYEFTMYDENVWRISFSSKEIALPRQIQIGNDLESVINQFNPSYEISQEPLQTIYGKLESDFELQGPMALLKTLDSGYELTITTKNFSPTLTFFFEGDVLNSVRLQYYVAN